MDEESHDEVEPERIEEPREKVHARLKVLLVCGGWVLLLLLLLGMVLPALFTAREMTNCRSCKSTLKELGIAIVVYIENAGGRYYPCPKGRPGVPDDYSGKHFLAMVWWTGVLSEPSLLLCPNSTGDNNRGYDLGVRDGQYLATDRGGVNQRGSAPANVPEPNWGPHSITYASKGWKVSYMPGSGKPEALIEELPSDTVIACDDTVDPPNHRNGFFVLYADSHVNFVSDPKYTVTEENGAVGRVAPLDMICN